MQFFGLPPLAQRLIALLIFGIWVWTCGKNHTRRQP